MTKTRISAVVLALLLVLSLTACGAQNAERLQSASAVGATEVGSGAKAVTLQVYHLDGSRHDYLIHTDAATLGDALLDEGIIAGEESQYGLFVKTVDGETADENTEQWWCLTKDGQMHEYGVDATEIADGEIYQFTLAPDYSTMVSYPAELDDAA